MMDNHAANISLLLTGNIPCPPSLIREKERYTDEALSFSNCFGSLKTMIGAADLTIGSLDASCEYPDEFIGALKSTGFGMLTMGPSSKEDDNRESLCRALDANQLRHPKGKTVGSSVIHVGGIRIGIIDCTFHHQYQDMKVVARVRKKVEIMKKEHVDFIICYVHWHFFIDSMLAIDERQRTIAKALANAGVNYIVGSGPLYLMRYETLTSNWNRQTPVAYSLGNLLGCSSLINQNVSAIIKLDIQKNRYGKITISDSYMTCYTWPVWDKKRRIIQHLNDRKYLYNSTKNLAEWRRFFATNRLGSEISVCHEFDVSKTVSKRPAPPTQLADAYTRERLTEADFLQKSILDTYRLTDDFRTLYGQQLYGDDQYSPVIQGAEHFLRIKYPWALEREDAKNIIIDMIYSRNVLGFDYNEYFCFHLMDRSISERIDFVSDRYRLNYYRQINTDYDENYYLDNKWCCYERIPHLFRRKVANIPDDSCRDQFAEFAEEFDKFIIKPVNGSLGQGIRIIDRKDWEDVDALFDELYTKTGPFICEELIVSREYFAALHPESCNSIRIFTYNNGTDIKFVCAWLKAGTGNAIVDNGGAGGVVASLNIETGTVDYDGANESGTIFVRHPDTGVTFKGFQVEEWESLKEIAKEAAAAFPTVKLIAWDIAHGQKGWQIIEGNTQGQMWVYQISSGIGMRKNLEEIIGW